MPEETTVTLDAIVAELQGNPADMPYRHGGGQWKSAKQIAHVGLGTRVRTNPEPQGEVVAPITADDLTQTLGLVGKQSLKDLRDSPLLVRFFEAAEAGDRESLTRLLQAAAKAEILSQPEVQAIGGYFSRTVPDPSWSPTVPDVSRFAELWGIGSIGVDKIQAALDVIGGA